MSGSLLGEETPAAAVEVLHFWFLELMPEHWFGGSDAVDNACESRFGGTLAEAAAGKLDHWAETPRGLLALVIVLDQFSRNIHRDTARAFAQDDKAQELVRQALEREWDDKLGMDERQFLYMPLMHAEDRTLQELCLDKFKAMAETASRIVGFAEKHQAIVERFGRFPYRNQVLGRESTAEERDFIDKEGNPFS
ncbi:DUF924 family protein [Erythrobacter ani]|uniref:DUF924 domain-containing protein n=1 Tax=Erythrobacter ani TaxID=2827235 RepID=A0ABS6SQA9_9SPHN|nr:DUF924 family protein [Erythrobacter ani]MBV7267200.1 DUF924 domain-containing protein [Erythrobacter ani]